MVVQHTTNYLEWWMTQPTVPKKSREFGGGKGHLGRWRCRHRNRIKPIPTFPVQECAPRLPILDKKKYGWSSRKMSLSDASWWTDARFRVAWGTCRTLLRKKCREGVDTMEWPMCFIIIPEPLATCTWSDPHSFPSSSVCPYPQWCDLWWYYRYTTLDQDCMMRFQHWLIH
jgi:hypothetical protein